jgi:glycosyltransferase involved in cell wall biosynthesis
MRNADAIVSVVAYLCNDADILGDFVSRATAVLEAEYAHFELILLDDHSTDRTPQCVEGLLQRHAGLRYVRLARRSGEEVAATAGLDAAIGDYVVVMRARFDPPESIPDLVALVEREGGTALGVTAAPPDRGWLFRSCRRLFYRSVGLLLRAHVPADSTGFCAMSRAVVNTISRTRCKSRHLRVLACTVGYPVTTHRYPLTRIAPPQQRRPLLDAFQDATRILVSSSQTPLRLVSALGILAGSFNLGYVLYVLAVYFFKKEVAPGWATLSLQLATMFFFVFLILVLLSEYVVQILAESQDNPLYHVESDRTSTVPAGAGRRNVLKESNVSEEKARRKNDAA